MEISHEIFSDNPLMDTKIIKSQFTVLPIEYLKRGPYQTRQDFNQVLLQELADSIKSQGIIQPIVIRQLESNLYEIVAGERRWRAAQLARFDKVPCLVNNYTDEQAIAVTTIENINRKDLNPIEEARAYQKFIDEFGYIHEEIAAIVGRSRTHITNCLRLLRLDERIQAFIQQGYLSYNHGKIIAGLKLGDQFHLAHLSVSNDWSIKRLTQEIKKRKKTTLGAFNRDPDTFSLERRISEQMGTEIKLEGTFKQGGWLKLKYYDVDTLESLLNKMGITDDE